MNISQLMAQSYHTLLEVMLHRKSEISSQQLQKIKASIFMPCIDKISLNLKKKIIYKVVSVAAKTGDTIK